MNRTSIVLSGLTLFLICALSLKHPVASAKSLAPNSTVGTTAVPMRGPSLTIVFRGLMAFHPDPAGQYFEAGILPAPDHELRMQVLEKSLDGVSNSVVPLGQYANLKSDIWLLEFPSKSKGVSFYQSGSFDRKSGVGNSRDFRWLIDLEGADFYNRKLQPNTSQLGVSFHIHSGEFYTKTMTLPLMRRRGDGTFEFFGRAAQEIAIDVFLEDGDMILRSEQSGTEMFRLKEKPDTTYEVVIENVPASQDHMAMSVNHFQYYYRLFPMARTDWYEFKVADRGTSLATSDVTKPTFTLASYLSPMPISDEAPCMGVGYGLNRP